MTVRPVTYYQVVCDEPNCGVTTSDRSDYSAWSSGSDAVEEWENAGGITVPDGLMTRHFCEDHANGKVCSDCGEVGTNLVRSDDGEFRCPEDQRTYIEGEEG